MSSPTVLTMFCEKNQIQVKTAILFPIHSLNLGSENLVIHQHNVLLSMISTITCISGLLNYAFILKGEMRFSSLLVLKGCE